MKQTITSLIIAAIVALTNPAFANSFECGGRGGNCTVTGVGNIAVTALPPMSPGSYSDVTVGGRHIRITWDRTHPVTGVSTYSFLDIPPTTQTQQPAPAKKSSGGGSSIAPAIALGVGVFVVSEFVLPGVLPLKFRAAKYRNVYVGTEYKGFSLGVSERLNDGDDNFFVGIDWRYTIK